MTERIIVDIPLRRLPEHVVFGEMGQDPEVFKARKFEDKKNYVKSHETYKQLSKKGNVVGIWGYASHLQRGVGCIQDLRTAYTLILKAASFGEPMASIQAALLYLNINNTPDSIFPYNVVKGIELLAYASTYLPKPHLILGDLFSHRYEHLRSAIPLDLTRSETHYRQFLQRPSLDPYYIESCYAGLANLLIEKNRQNPEAGLLYKKAVALNKIGRGAYALAMSYLNGTAGLKQDVSLAKRMFEDLADSGDTVAAFNLGLFYEEGSNGCAQDWGQARQYYLKAAAEPSSPTSEGTFCVDGSHIKAHNNLGIIYFNGHGVERDVVKGNYHYKQAADLGNPKSQSSYSFNLYFGIGVQKNQKEALRYCTLAAAQGNATAKKNLEMFSQESEVLVFPTESSFLATSVNSKEQADFVNTLFNEQHLMSLCEVCQTKAKGECACSQALTVYRRECEYCKLESPELLACSRCGVQYCSKDCQRLAWKGGHKKVCRAPEEQ